MSHLLDQIAIEKQRISVFEEKIAQCKKRIAALEFLMQDADDELDTLASNAIISGSSFAPAHHSVRDSSVIGGSRKRPINQNQLALLKFIGVNGKTLKELEAFSKENGFGMNDQNLRNFAMIYRKRYGLLDNPHPGFYRLTMAGQDAIK